MYLKDMGRVGLRMESEWIRVAQDRQVMAMKLRL